MYPYQFIAIVPLIGIVTAKARHRIVSGFIITYTLKQHKTTIEKEAQHDKANNCRKSPTWYKYRYSYFGINC